MMDLTTPALAAGVVAALSFYCMRRALQRRLAHQALHDSLTKLPNRQLFTSRLTTSLARARRRGHALAVLVLDLDRFRAVNQRWGPDRGDLVIKEVAARLLRVAREEDTVARLGGDEFSVLLEEIPDGTAAARVAERMLREVQAPFWIDDAEYRVAASVGVGISDPDGKCSAQDVLRDADLALQRAKERGSASYQIFQRSTHEEARRRLALEADLRMAVKDEQFRLHYQPQVRLADTRVVGAEALVRWQHPTLGLLTPQNFISAAEHTGLILELGRIVLEGACRTAVRHRSQFQLGSGMGISVNVSGSQLRSHGRFVEDVLEILESTGLEPDALTLELTETVLMEDPEAIIAPLRDLRDLGVGIAIDDFGTGYSSLAYLKDLPVSSLKLDRSFVQGCTEAVGRSIVQSIVDLGAALGITVVAEGIETHEELWEVRSMGCAVGQGFYFWKPMPEDEIAALLDLGPPRFVLPKSAAEGAPVTAKG